MDNIVLKKEEAAFYFNQATLNLRSLDGNIDRQYEEISNNDKKRAKTALEKVFTSLAVLQKTENFVFNFRDVAKNSRNEIENLILKLVDLRNFYSHYVHGEHVKELSGGEKAALEKYYQIAVEATGSQPVSLKILDGNKLTDAGVLLLLCMFLKKAQANKLISTISGFKRNDPEGQPRRNLFTYYSVREGYKVVPDMQKHFLLFTLVSHLVNQEEYIQNKQRPEGLEKGLFFQRIASTFLNISGILKNMKFYTFQSKRLEDQRGKIQPSEESFTWIEPFQGNSYFTLGNHKGVLGEDQLKELCFALLVERKDIQAIEGKITQFLKKFTEAESREEAEKDLMMSPDYFPANYFQKADAGKLKELLTSRLETRKRNYGSNPDKAYDKMKEVLDFINSCLPADEKLRQKDYRRYLKMVRFWAGEKNNIKREFDNKEWTRYLPREFWQKRNLEEIYELSREQNKKQLQDLQKNVMKLNEHDFEKYQRINQAGSIEGLRTLCREYSLEWNEKEWVEYSRQIKKPVTDRQKLTIMKQRVTAALKKQQGIENLNLRINTDRDKSRQAVMNRIALPKGFVREHVLGIDEKISKKIRERQCLIELSEQYRRLSEKALASKDLVSLTKINDLLEKNKLIAYMILYLMEKLALRLNGKTNVSKLNETSVKYRITNRVTVDIPLSKYPSLIYAISRDYVNKIDNYKRDEWKKTLLEKIDSVEKERFEFISQVLGFEKYLFDKKVIDRSRFSNTYISFLEICNELIQKGWDREPLDKVRNARNKALHGDIPDGITFHEAKSLVEVMKKE